MKNQMPMYTNLEITKRKEIGLKRYFNSISRNLPDNWKIRKNNYEDNDTFYILNDTICFVTPFFRAMDKDEIFNAEIFLGLTDDFIFILKININPAIEKDNSIINIAYINNYFHDEILKPNKHYDSFNHKFEFGGPNDENWHSDDIRNMRTIKVYSKSDKKTYTLAKGSLFESDNTKVLFHEPNNIALSLNLMKKSYKNAFKIYKDLNLTQPSSKIEIDKDKQSLLFEYFEEIITSIIFSYIAIESMTNAAIDEDYKYEKTNDKGIIEIWGKESIERWMTTSEKVSEVLPNIFNSSNIKEENFWTQFKLLEKLRNDIIHQKTIENGTRLDSHIYKELLNSKVFEKIKSSLSIIQFFYKLDNAHPYFPLGMGIAKFKIEEIESMQEYFKHFEY